jgi:hypothetical protein
MDWYRVPQRCQAGHHNRGSVPLFFHTTVRRCRFSQEKFVNQNCRWVRLKFLTETCLGGRLMPLIVPILKFFEADHIVGQHRPIALCKPVVV